MADWDDLRFFLAVARAESLSRAGQALRLDPATVGRRIARLEGDLGATLFRRSAQGYTPTEEGARLMETAVRAEQAMLGALTTLRAGPGGLSGQVRVGAPDGCANYLMPQVVAAICDENPGLEVQIVALPRVFNLSKREADMAIAVSPPAAGRVVVQRVTDYHLHLAAARSYLATHPAITTPDDLRAHRIVGYIPDMIFDPELDYLAGLGLPAPALASNSVPVQFNWIRAGAGVGIVHAFAMPSAPDVVPVLEGEIRLTRAFWLIRHADDRASERLTRFATALAEGVRREVARLEVRPGTAFD